jgi:hypothetical protein
MRLSCQHIPDLHFGAEALSTRIFRANRTVSDDGNQRQQPSQPFLTAYNLNGLVVAYWLA